MKLSEPKNRSYAATVVRVQELVKLENCDNVQGLQWGGMQAIVGMDTQVGDIGVLFPTEAVLSHEYVFHNNLYRHAERNIEPYAKPGYIEDDRRIRSVKFRGHRSDAFFMPISSLAWTKASITGLREGDVFDELHGQPICTQWVRPVKRGVPAKVLKWERRVEKKLFPEQAHISHFLRELRHLDPSAPCVVTQKLHGTNLRVGNTLVRRKQGWLEKILARFGVQVPLTEYAVVFGSHLSIKGIEASPGAVHYYDEDVWQHHGEKIAALVPQGYIVYGELVGFTLSGKALQPHYTYQCRPREAKLYVYRVATVNPQGVVCDLSWPAVKEFCKQRGLAHVPELWNCTVQEVEGGLADILDTKFHPLWGNAVPLSDDSPCDEGVCIRIEGISPLILKAKAPIFVAHETHMRDAGEEDIEEEESQRLE